MADDVVFATKAEIAARLGRSLSTDEQEQAELLIQSATWTIIAAVGEDQDWADALDPVPGVIRMITIEMVARVMMNAEGLAVATERLGLWSYTREFPPPHIESLFLTPDERRQVRREAGASAFQTVTFESPYSGPVTDDLSALDFPTPLPEAS